MDLIREAVIINLFGTDMYAFGVYTALGTLAAMAVIAAAGRAYGLKPGTAPLAALLGILLGAGCSRLVFCLLNRELGSMMPLSAWVQIAGGGWSVTGLIGGVFAAGWLAARIAKDNSRKTMDMMSLAVLPVIIAERIGESRTEDFDISRPLDNAFLARSFLATGEEEPCLATYYVAAAAAVVIFLFLVFRMQGNRREGHTAISFLMTYGAAAIVLESLRYDRFLSISFVGLQQIAAALMLAAGVILAVKESGSFRKPLAVAALISIPLMAGIVLGLEFALDRTTWNKLLLYAAMIVTVAVPTVMGHRLLGRAGKGKQRREEKQ